MDFVGYVLTAIYISLKYSPNLKISEIKVLFLISLTASITDI